MSCAPRKSSTFALQSRLRDELVKDCGREMGILFAQDPPLFGDYSEPSLPELSSRSDSDCDSSSSSDSEDDVDPYRYHAGYLVTPEDLHTHLPDSPCYDIEDTPYIPTVDLPSFVHDALLGFNGDESFSSSSSSPLSSSDLIEAISPAASPFIPTASIADVVPVSPSPISPKVELSPEDVSFEDIGSDEDAQGDSDYEPAEEDDEYTLELEYPSSRKRCASSQLDRISPELISFSPSTYSSSSTSSRSSSVVSTTSSKRPRISFHSRNHQAAPENKVSKSDPWACPFDGCPWVQRNRRSPDLKRHIKTHSRSQDEWVCCGIDAWKARHYKRDPSEKPYDYKGKPMVGGCMKTFARRDALKRHLDNQNIKCVGDLTCYFD